MFASVPVPRRTCGAQVPRPENITERHGKSPRPRGTHPACRPAGYGELTCADDSCGLQSEITPTVTAGVTYLITVDGYDGSDQAPFTLTVTPP